MDFFTVVFYLLIRSFFCRLLLLLLLSYYFKFLVGKKGQTKQEMQLKTKTNIKFRNREKDRVDIGKFFYKLKTNLLFLQPISSQCSISIPLFYDVFKGYINEILV